MRTHSLICCIAGIFVCSDEERRDNSAKFGNVFLYDRYTIQSIYPVASNTFIGAYKKANLNNRVKEMDSLMTQDEYLPDMTEIGAKLINLGKTGYYIQIENILFQ